MGWRITKQYHLPRHIESSQDILQLLKEYDIHDINMAHCESVVQSLAGPPLLAPIIAPQSIQDVADWATTALGLPIASLATPNCLGTLGFYFVAGGQLYGVKAWHVLFPSETKNETYLYVATFFPSEFVHFWLPLPDGPKKEVVLMGDSFGHFLEQIKAKIGNLHADIFRSQKTIGLYRMQAAKAQRLATEAAARWDPKAKAEAEAREKDLQEALAEYEIKVQKMFKAIQQLNDFYVTMQREWSATEDQVFGHIVWAPPIPKVSSHDYTQDVCIAQLILEKFWPNLQGNNLDLGRY